MSAQIIIICEGDSITATVAGSSVNGASNISRASYPYVAAGLTPDAIPGANIGGASASYASMFFPFFVSGMLCLNRSIGGSRLQTNPETNGGVAAIIAGTPGATAGDLTYRASTWIDALFNTSTPKPPITRWEDTRPLRKYILSVLIGTNDSPVGSEAAWAANYATYLNARITASGGQIKGIVVGTLIPRADGIAGGTAYTQAASDNFDNMRHTINTILRGSSWKSSINVPVQTADFGALSGIGADGAALTSSYTLTPSPVSAGTALFVDGIHPSALGYAQMTVEWLAKVNALVAMI